MSTNQERGLRVYRWSRMWGDLEAGEAALIRGKMIYGPAKGEQRSRKTSAA
jgi:hypothetical protein